MIRRAIARDAAVAAEARRLQTAIVEADLRRRVRALNQAEEALSDAAARQADAEWGWAQALRPGFLALERVGEWREAFRQAHTETVSREAQRDAAARSLAETRDAYAVSWARTEAATAVAATAQRRLTRALEDKTAHDWAERQTRERA